ncbi:MAG: prepilin-type N-terminal cleavage/methylation domain-containing protein [Verrucomicrobia bacterium]|nr:prepilin-type N-terminal cleavage/methylation domain-containing protein [Verrucomicrobiota bacterium]
MTLSLRKSKKQRAFSLLELLAVTAILALLAGLLAPALHGLTSPTGRKGAVTIVMNTLEQARVSAIETGREVVVVFWKKNGTDASQPDEQDAMLILRKNDAEAWEPITRWIKLPRGVLFHGEDSESKILYDNSGLAAVSVTTIDSLPGKPSKNNLGAIHFSSTGAVQLPSTSNGLRIALTEGQRGVDQTLIVNKQKDGGHEIISLARYTGRATLDVSML